MDTPDGIRHPAREEVNAVKNGFNFDRGFDGWWWIRGQEEDRFMTNPTKDADRRKRSVGAQYLQNVSLRRFEEDYFVAQTMASAARWLELNYDQHEKFFLYVDTFDPHEPWDPPKWYADKYDPDWKGVEIIGGAYIPGMPYPTIASGLTQEEVKHLRALYAGEATLVDRWVGMLLQKIEDLGLYESTAVIFTSDHGTYIGEHGYVSKHKRLYEEVAHVPLMIRLPDSASPSHHRREDIVQSPDLMPTILDLAGVATPSTAQAETLVPRLRNEETQERDIAISSPTLMKPNPWITTTAKDWAFLATRKDAPAADDFAKKIEPELYNLAKDPKQTQNIYKENTDIAKVLLDKLMRFLRAKGAREEDLKNWRLKE